MTTFKIEYSFGNSVKLLVSELPEFPEVYKSFWGMVKERQLWKKAVRRYR